jgi:hypothetical protein
MGWLVGGKIRGTKSLPHFKRPASDLLAAVGLGCNYIDKPAVSDPTIVDQIGSALKGKVSEGEELLHHARA